jgi:hypothetical protein
VLASNVERALAGQPIGELDTATEALIARLR